MTDDQIIGQMLTQLTVVAVIPPIVLVLLLIIPFRRGKILIILIPAFTGAILLQIALLNGTIIGPHTFQDALKVYRETPGFGNSAILSFITALIVKLIRGK